MVDKSKIPEIWFKGFGGEWEENKIGEVLTEKKRPIELEDNTTYQLVTVKRRNAGVVSRGLLKGKNILVKNYFEIKTGDYLISKRQVVHGANGIVPQRLDMAVVSNEYLVSVGNKKITTKFWTIISTRADMYKKFYISSYGVDIEKLVFDVDDWKKRTIVIPTLVEQKRITGFFQQIDTLISLHQRKVDKLLNVKKAMLEKIFPKKGADLPEIRFKGFSDKWEERELGDEVEIIGTGKSIFVASVEKSENKPYAILGSRTIIGYDSEYDYSGSFILTARVGENAGKLYRYSGKVKISDNTVYIEGQNLDFTFYLLTKFNVKKLSFGTGQPLIKASELNNLKLMISDDKKEQTKIGNFFKNLDTLLSLHQSQLKKLKNIKKACLEKMFVS